ncbi:hypothetical protein ACJIZ3_014844 [Penstemon smallii]|uniref:Uncharacterized protein n=1 Tax=Penstemon smallii TaxID=265156 RepID=A0ABD3RNY0_9LAMI
MRLPLEERCQIISMAYAKSIRESDVILAVMRKKMMVGCPEKYYDVDSIAKRNYNTTYLEEERLDNEKRLMRWPLELRCSLVSDAYAQGIRESEPHLAAMTKKLSVGCPEKFFDIAMSSIADKS